MNRRALITSAAAAASVLALLAWAGRARHEQTVMLFGRKNRNGRIYSTEHTKFAPTGLLVATEHGILGKCQVDPSKCVGRYTNMRVEGDRLICEVHIDPVPSLIVPEMIRNGSARWVTSGTGNVDRTGAVTDYELTALFATDDPSFVL